MEDRKVVIPLKSMVKRKEVKTREVRVVEEMDMEEEEDKLVEGFKKLRMTATNAVILIKNETDTCEVELSLIHI